MSYERLRSAKAFSQTICFWNIHQAWSLAVPSLVGLIVALTALYLKVGKISTSNEVLYAVAITAAFYGLMAAAATFAVGWIGSYVINYFWAAPAKLHEEQQARISAQELRIQALGSKIAGPALSPREQANRAKVAEAITGAEDNELQLLRYLLDHEEAEVSSLYRALGGNKDGAIDRCIYRFENVLLRRRIEAGTHNTFFSVIPGIKDALAHRLYESQ